MTAAGARAGPVPAVADLPPLAVAAILLLLAWTSVMLPGFAFPYGNNMFHVPIVLGYAGSAEGPHDAFTRSLDHFVSAVFPLLGLVANERNVAGVFFAAHLASRLLFVAGVYGLIRHFSAPRALALALAGLAALAPLFKVESPVGRNDTLIFYFTHTELAMAMLPGCWWLLLRGRWVAGAAAIGLMFNVNAFLSIWSVAAALAAIIAARPQIEHFPKKLLLCGTAFVVAASPTAIWTLRTVMEPSRPIDFRAFLLSYYPFHTFIHVQWERGVRYLAYLIAAGLAVRAALHQLPLRGAEVLAALLAGFTAIFLLGLPWPYLTSSQLLLNLYPLRLDSVVNLLIAVIMLAWAGQSLGRADRERDALPLAIALALLVGNMIAALLLLHLRSARQGDQRERTVTAFATAAAMALLFVIGALPELVYGVIPVMFMFCGLALCAAFGRSDHAERPWIAVVTAALVCSMLGGPSGFPWPMAGLAAAVLLLVAALPGAIVAGLASALFTCLWALGVGKSAGPVAAAAALTAAGLLFTLPPRWRPIQLIEAGFNPKILLAGIGAAGVALSAHAVARGTLEPPDMDSRPAREAQRWVRSHVPADAPLLAVGVEDFGILARRPIWVEHKAGAAAMWEPDYLAEWQPRMDALNRCRDSVCYAGLARGHRLRWIVAAPGRLKRPGAAGLRLRFRNTSYEIYSVDGAVAATGG